MNLPQKPSKQWFAENLTTLWQTLKERTDAKIALLTIPPIGEVTDDKAYIHAKHFSAIIDATARKMGITPLPLNEKMDTYLSENKSKPVFPYNKMVYVMYKAIFYHIILGKSWDDISSDNGFSLITDYLHLNCNAAGMVADLIEEFLQCR